MTYPDDRNDNQPNTITAQNNNRLPSGAHTLATSRRWIVNDNAFVCYMERASFSPARIGTPLVVARRQQRAIAPYLTRDIPSERTGSFSWSDFAFGEHDLLSFCFGFQHCFLRAPDAWQMVPEKILHNRYTPRMLGFLLLLLFLLEGCTTNVMPSVALGIDEDGCQAMGGGDSHEEESGGEYTRFCLRWVWFCGGRIGSPRITTTSRKVVETRTRLGMRQ